jgi:hypothetical protein
MPLAEAKKEGLAGDQGRTGPSPSRRFGITLYRNGRKLRTFFPEKSMTIGREPDNDIVYHQWSGSERFTLVEKVGAERFFLNVTDNVVGKVRFAKSEMDFSDLICSGVLPRKNGVYQFEITDGKEEELHFGELTFKIGFEIPPAPPEIVSISKIMPTRRSPLATMDDEDRRFTYLFLAILTLSVFFLIFAFRVGSASNLIKVQDIPEVVAQLVDVEDLQNQMTGTSETKTEGPGAGGGGGESKNYGPSGDGTGVLTTGLLGLLTTEGSSGGPSVVDILGNGSGVGDIDAVLGGLGGLTTSGAGGGLGGGGLGGLGGLGGSGGMDLAALLGGGGGGGFDSSELETAGTVTLTGPSSISGTGAGESGRTSSAISSVIAAHMAGLQSAYNAQLKRNPNLSGKIVVTFTINAQGVVTNAYVTSSTMNCPELESQIVSRIYGWKFPAVSGGEVTVIYPFVFIKT